MKYVHLPLDISAAALPVLEGILRNVLDTWGTNMTETVAVEVHNLTNQLWVSQQRLLQESKK